MAIEVSQYGKLPHWTDDKAIYHVVFRLIDSVPVTVFESWHRERKEFLHRAETDVSFTEKEREKWRNLFSAKVEKYLNMGKGSCVLKNALISNIVRSALLHGEGKMYSLHAWCIMPNHVHVIVEPFLGHDLLKIVRSWKKYSALKANFHLRRKGAFWLDESYDRIIRSEREYYFQVKYVWKNPDKPRLDNVPRWKLGMERM